MKKLFDLLSVKQNVVITTHANPDGDAIGSSLALYNFLIKYDHNVNVIVPNPYPDFLTWMKGNDDVVIYSNEKEKARSLVNHSSIIFCLDFNNLSRINELGELINLSKSVKVTWVSNSDVSDIGMAAPDREKLKISSLFN